MGDFVERGENSKSQRNSWCGGGIQLHCQGMLVDQCCVSHVQNWTKLAKKEVPGGFDVIVDGTGGQGFGGLVSLLGLGGKLVTYGATAGLK